jgi:biopolymer transport protein ExbD
MTMIRKILLLAIISIQFLSCDSQTNSKTSLTLPDSKSCQPILGNDKRLDFNIYINDKNFNSQEIIIEDKTVSVSEIESHFKAHIESNNIDLHKKFNAILYIDKNLPMSFINEIKLKLILLGFDIFTYITNDNPVKGFSLKTPYLIPEIYGNPNLRKQHIYETIRENSKPVTLPPSAPSNAPAPPRKPENIIIKESLFKKEKIENENIQIVKFNKENKIVFNDRIIQDLETELLKAIENGNFYFILYSNENIKYQDYITVLSLIRSCIFNVRDNRSKETFNKKFDELTKHNQKSIMKEVPYNFIELLTDEVKFLEKNGI